MKRTVVGPGPEYQAGANTCSWISVVVIMLLRITYAICLVFVCPGVGANTLKIRETEEEYSR